MIEPRYRAFLWIAALIALAMLLLALAPTGPPPRPIWREYLVAGIVYGTLNAHTTLAATWVALGPLPLKRRLFLSIAWVAAILFSVSIPMAIRGPRVEMALFMTVIWGSYLLAQWAVAQVPWWGLAFGFGLRLQHVNEPNLAHDRRIRQFGIRQLLIVTAIVAVILGIGRVVLMRMSGDDFFSRRGPWVLLVSLALAGVIMTIPVVLSVLLPRRAIPATFVVLILVGLSTQLEAPLLNAASRLPVFVPGHLYAINGFQAAWVLAVIGVLRLGGYGLVAVTPTADNARSGKD